MKSMQKRLQPQAGLLTSYALSRQVFLNLLVFLWNVFLVVLRDFFKIFREVFLKFSIFRQRRPRQKKFRDVRELEIRLLSKFQLRTTLGGHKIAEKPKLKKHEKNPNFDRLFTLRGWLRLA